VHHAQEKTVNIYDVLHDEHKYILDLLERLPRTRTENRRELVSELVDAVTSHAQAEENVLYNRLHEIPDLTEVILEAKEEHHVVTRSLEELVAMRSEDERFTAKVKLIREMLQLHIDEEESIIFKGAQRVFDDDIAVNFAGEFIAQKAALQDKPNFLRFGQARIKKIVEDVGHVIRPGGSAEETR